MVTLNPIADMSPVPRVEVTFTSVPTGTATATTYRITGDRTMRVRGMVGVAASGGFGGVDTEPPFNQQITYRAELFDASGTSLGFTESATTVVPFAGTVIHQPLDPSRSVQVVAQLGAAAEIKRPFIGELVRPLGRSVPVYVGSGRTGIEDVALDCITDTREQAEALESVFGGYDGDEQLPVVCFRTSLPMGLPQPLFALVQTPTRQPFEAHTGGEGIIWKLSGSEAAPPAEAIVLALLTYQDLETAFTDYATLEAAYLTYLDMETDFDLAGA